MKVSNRGGHGSSFEGIRARMLYDGGLVGEHRSFSFYNQAFSYALPLNPNQRIEQAPSDYIIRLVGNEIPPLTD